LAAECAKVWGRLLGLAPADGLGFGLRGEAKVAAGVGSFVVLFGEGSNDQADYGVGVGEDAINVGAATDLPVWSFVQLGITLTVPQ